MPPRPRMRRSKPVVSDEPLVERSHDSHDVQIVAEFPVWTVRATHAFEDWGYNEERWVAVTDRVRGLVTAGFLEVVDDRQGEGTN